MRSDFVAVKVKFGAPVAEIAEWCAKQIGPQYHCWTYAANAHHFIFTIPKKDRTIFLLRWS